MPIDWARIEQAYGWKAAGDLEPGETARLVDSWRRNVMNLPGLDLRAGWKAPAFTADQITAAQKAVKALPSVDGNPDHIALPWAMGKKFPDISDIDFGDAVQQILKLADLKAATTHDWLGRQKVLDHLAKPGQSIHADNPFTVEPICCQTGQGDTLIVDGHHRLAALMLLGATNWQLWVVPTSKALAK